MIYSIVAQAGAVIGSSNITSTVKVITKVGKTICIINGVPTWSRAQFVAPDFGPSKKGRALVAGITLCDQRKYGLIL